MHYRLSLCVLAAAAVLSGCGSMGGMMGGSKKQVIASPDAPKAIGPYSQAIRVGDTVYLAGQIPIDPKTNQLVTGSIEQQTRVVMDNLAAVLKAAGMSFDNVVMAHCFLRDLNDFGKFNETYATYFKDGMPPGRATVQVARLPRDVAVEVAFVAVK
jgi:2-iminobutanoate/2-iminopropanoate deaminase